MRKFKRCPNSKYLQTDRHLESIILNLKFGSEMVENIVEQQRQIVARYARLTPSCKAGACTGQNSSMKNNKGH